MIELAVLVLAVAAFVWLLDRRDRRHAGERAQLLALMHAEREAMAQRVHDERIALENARAETTPDLAALVSLVRDLCQRIQAPTEAIVQHQMDAGPVFAPPAVLPDDDEGWYEARLSKEELAQRAMEQELADRAVVD